MSTPSPEPSRNPIRRIGARVSRWQNTRRGTKTLKAAYAQAARDVKRMDPAVRERIGRANMTKADLQVLAQAHVAGEFSPEQRRVGQMLNDRVAARVQEAGASAAPTRNPIRRLTNRISRWRNTRQGTKALKAAYAQAARDVKRMDPAIREQIGRSGMTRSDLQFLAQSRMEQAFRPEGRLGALPGQQQAQPSVQAQVQGDSRAAQLAAQVAALESQVGQLRAQVAEGQHNVGIHPVVPTQQPEAQQPQADGQQPEVSAQQPEAQQPQAESRQPQSEGHPQARQPQAEAQGQRQPQPQNQQQAQPQAQTPTQRAEVNQTWVNAASGQGQRSLAGQQVPAAGQQPVGASRQADVQQMVAANQEWAATHGTGQQSAGNQADVKGGLSKSFDAAFSGTAQPSVSAEGQAGRATDSPGDGARQRTTTTSAKRDGQSSGL
jgi:hypothetical protein